MTSARRPVFPFTALVAQDAMKRALVLNTINPRIGGVLIRGEKGTAKSTAVRALVSLLPEITVVAGCAYACDPAAPDSWCDDCRTRAAGGSVADSSGPRTMAGRTVSSPSAGAGIEPVPDPAEIADGPLPTVRRHVPLVELPVGATEDRVVGTLNLERAIKEGERHFEPGLLATANRGILYVDEVNLLNDHLVDVLLDAAAMGVNYVEREGVSVQHPSQFILVGTMNPEEGDLRPQLLDRFALAVEVEGIPQPAARAEVVRRRIAYEDDPRGFAAAWEAAEAAERARILAAHALLPSVRLDDHMLGLIAQLCCDFEVDGLRADIVMYKTALTLAAYAGRRGVTEADVRDAAELALLHRRRRQPFQQPELDRERLEEAIRDYLEREPPPPAPPPAGTRDESPGDLDDADDPSDDPGDAPAGDAPPRVFAPSPPPAPPPLAAPPPPRLRAASRGRRSRAEILPWQGAAPPSGHYVRAVVPRERPRDLAFDATFRAAAPHQQRRRERDRAATDPPAQGPTGPAESQRVAPAIRLERQDLRQKVRASRLSNLILFVVDASGSMAARERMAAAKGAALALLLDAYRKRDQVGLIAFRGRGAELLLPPTNSVDLAEARLRALPTGGRTPLAHGLDLACRTLDRHREARAEALPLLVLISDGRANVGLGAGADLMAEIAGIGARLQQRHAASVVIDSEAGPLRLGLARQVAAALGARYLTLGELDGARLASVVREVRS
jgi:magnesium chelatase subunit D